MKWGQIDLSPEKITTKSSALLELKDKRGIIIANAFQKDVDQIKYLLIKVVNFTIIFSKDF